MNTVKFAMFINYLTKIGMGEINSYEMQAIHDQAQNFNDPTKASITDVDELLRTIKLNEFIPAIKAYRTLTGAGLKEAKEAIERYRVNTSHPETEKINV